MVLIKLKCHVSSADLNMYLNQEQVSFKLEDKKIMLNAFEICTVIKMYVHSWLLVLTVK
jgi:hypothetical protein